MARIWNPAFLDALQDLSGLPGRNGVWLDDGKRAFGHMPRIIWLFLQTAYRTRDAPVKRTEGLR